MESNPQAEKAAARVDDPLREARRVLEVEIAGLRAVQQRLDSAFTEAVDLVFACRGRVIVTGLGKSGIAAKKVAGTLTSTGTPALYLHPVEAAHGDIGLLSAEDLLLVVSYSGANDEMDALLGAARRLHMPIVALTGNPGSALGQRADIVIDCRVPEEACPLGLAPTASTTAAIALGDALAVTLLQKRGFGVEQFAQSHPSGVLGRRLSLTVGDIMRQGDELPVVDAAARFRDALPVMMRCRLGCVFIVDAAARLIGIVTDGDLKRILVREVDVMDRAVADFMVRDPKRIDRDALVVHALRRMEENEGGAITQLVVVDAAGRLVGAIHMHDIVRVGLAQAAPGS